MQKNRPMRILTGLAIILVVLGHIDWNVMTIFGLFPYYSYHVLIFVFVSGYFYNPENEKSIFKYLKKKFLHLMLPYFIWNLIYGIISTLLAGRDFIFCNKITPFNFFIEPFLGGHQYGFNFAAWFVPALFMIEIIYILGRKVLSLIRLDNDWLIFALLMLAGIMTVWLAQTGHIWDFYRTPGRILFMLPVYQLGRIYRTGLEAKDNLPSYIYFPIVIAVQLGLYFLTDGVMNFSAVWCSGFTGLPIMPYLTTITGIALWLRIARLLAKVRFGKVVELIGDNSFAIMMHHVMVIFIINSVFFAITFRLDTSTGFDLTQFKENINYVCTPGGFAAWKLLYTIVPIGVSVLLGTVVFRFKSFIHKKANTH